MEDQQAFISALASGSSVTVKVRPSAERTAFRGKLGNGIWKVDIAAAPESGKANQELVCFVSKQLSLPRSLVEIIAGSTARTKIVRIRR